MLYVTTYVAKAGLLVIVAVLGLTRGELNAEPSVSEKVWDAPSSAAAQKNPVAPTPDSLAAGNKIFLKRCVACHGKAGDGDGPDAADLGINPGKLSDPRLRAESDGALYWKITVGKQPMPHYGGRLSPADRWNLVNYIRTLVRSR